MNQILWRKKLNVTHFTVCEAKDLISINRIQIVKKNMGIAGNFPLRLLFTDSFDELYFVTQRKAFIKI